MTETKAKNPFIWWWKRFTTNSWKEWYNIEVKREKFDKLPDNWKWFVKLTMWERKQPSDINGDTHYLIHNNYEPKKSEDTEESQF